MKIIIIHLFNMSYLGSNNVPAILLVMQIFHNPDPHTFMKFEGYRGSVQLRCTTNFVMFSPDDVEHDVIVILNLPCKSTQVRFRLQFLKLTS